MNPKATGCRHGLTMIELVAAASILVIVMSFVTTLCFRVSLVWRDIGHHRVALAELSNQLDRLTRLEPQQIRDELESLEASELSRQTLREPQLTGKLVSTELGTQINLQLNWKRRFPAEPVELSGWVSGEPVVVEELP